MLRRLLALVLSLFAPGLGYYFQGRVWWFVACLVSYALAWTGFVLAAHLGSQVLFAVSIGFAAVVTVGGAVHAASVTSNAVPPAKRVVLVGVVALLACRGLSMLVKQELAETFAVPTGSMRPSLPEGTRVLASKTRSAVERGDVVVFAPPGSENTLYVKRVVALGGDTVELADGSLSINGKPVAMGAPVGVVDGTPLVREGVGSASWLTLAGIVDGPATQQPLLEVPAGSVYLLGDNRDNSMDSRHFGPVRESRIVGVIRLVYWQSLPITIL